jgi:proteasome assembly chaperone (PAC2) family protein
MLGYQGGEKVGKHKVLGANVDVQLGEDLSENMREVKVSTPASSDQHSHWIADIVR